jgi:iron complex transport system substrate-binding protein
MENRFSRPLCRSLVFALLWSAFLTPAFAVPFTDSTGRTVDLPARITRIAPSGSLAQLFLAALVPDKLVCLSSMPQGDGAKYLPSALRGLPVVGQFYGQGKLNVETIAALDPQVIIDIGETKKTARGDMERITAKTGIPALFIAAPLFGSGSAFRTLGKLLGQEADGEKLARFCENTLALADAALKKAGGKKPRLLYCTGRSGTNVIARDSYHAEVLDKLSDNAAVVNSPSARGTGNETDREQLLLWNPDVIVFSQEASPIYKRASKDAVWKLLSAVKSGHFYLCPQSPYGWLDNPPSCNRYLGVLYLTKLLYHADFDMEAQTREYYALFYHYQLSHTEYAAITEGAF